jgi:TolB-like protein
LHVVEKKSILYLMLAPGFSVDAARSHLEKVLASPCFARNERLSRFLRFIVERHLEGQDRELKETLIAIQVFGRKPDYDPKLDSIVRTEATRLRARLAEYYAGEGSSDPITIEMPKGAYVPVVSENKHGLSATAPSRTRQRIWIAIGAAVALGSVVAVSFLLSHVQTPVTIAVLPLENLGHDPSNDEFVDGLSAEIIRNLSLIDGLSVRSQTSSFAFRGKPRDVREAGKQLHVDYIIEGSVLRAGQGLRIDAQLVRVRDDTSLWSRRFDRKLSDIFAIQDEISRGIVNGLRLKLGRGRRHYETSVEAYDLYLRARSLPFLGFRKAIPLFEEAIDKDPAFAPAYGGLASAYWAASQLGNVQGMDLEEAIPKMRAAANKAIQLDPLLAEAHEALGLVYARGLQWAQAKQSFQEALRVDPNSSRIHASYGTHVLWEIGRVEEAVRELRAAQKADPLSANISSDFAFLLIAAGRYDEAAVNAERAIRSGSGGLSKQFLGRVRFWQGRTDEAISLFRQLGNGSEGFLGFALARAGHREEAIKLLSVHPDRPNQQVLIYAGLGDHDHVFESLDRMLVIKDQRVRIYLTFPELSLIRGDPRLMHFRKKAGLPE